MAIRRSRWWLKSDYDQALKRLLIGGHDSLTDAVAVDARDDGEVAVSEAFCAPAPMAVPLRRHASGAIAVLLLPRPFSNAALSLRV